MECLAEKGFVSLLSYRFGKHDRMKVFCWEALFRAMHAYGLRKGDTFGQL